MHSLRAGKSIRPFVHSLDRSSCLRLPSLDSITNAMLTTKINVCSWATQPNHKRFWFVAWLRSHCFSLHITHTLQQINKINALYSFPPNKSYSRLDSTQLGSALSVISVCDFSLRLLLKSLTIHILHGHSGWIEWKKTHTFIWNYVHFCSFAILDIEF